MSTVKTSPWSPRHGHALGRSLPFFLSLSGSSGPRDRELGHQLTTQTCSTPDLSGNCNRWKTFPHW